MNGEEVHFDESSRKAQNVAQKDDDTEKTDTSGTSALSSPPC